MTATLAPTSATLTALLAAVLESPADDLPRLVYADALEESGDVDRAEVIRLQIERFPMECQHISYPATPGCRRCELRDRIAHLYRRGGPARDTFGLPEEWCIDAVGTGEKDWPSLICRRGFGARYEGPLAAWMEHGSAVVRLHPLERVTITDREPYRLDQPEGSYTWLMDGEPGDPVAPFRGYLLMDDGPHADRFRLPRDLYLELNRQIGESYRFGWPARDAALSALSDAAIRWAKSTR